MSKIAAIIGRPNVGKSTFFNRLTESRKAIVHEESGVTRDRHYGKVEWSGVEFSLIDTGGYVTNSDDVFEEEIRKQVHIAINEADLILFMVDATSGITDLDDAVAGILRKSNKQIILLVNKVDTNEMLYETHQFHKLGLGDFFAISSINGSGTGELLDAIVALLPDDSNAETDDDLPHFAIVGRPNVGKSSLINAFIGEERNIVTPVSGTTRDTIHTRYQKFSHDFYLIDTAGLRKKGKVHENVEFYSVMRAIRAIESADVCLLMIDAERGLESQDMNIFNIIVRNRKGIVVLVNKWDLLEKDTHSTKKFTAELKQRFAPFNDLPIIFTSALTNQRIYKAIETAMEVYKNRRQKIPTSKLNEVLQKTIEKYPPPSVKGKFIKIKYVTQLPTHAPSFAFFCNRPQYVRDAYKRFLENQIRQNFNFTGVPLQIFLRKK